jgi:uncharacterized protein
VSRGPQLDTECSRGSGVACRDLGALLDALDGGGRVEGTKYLRKGCGFGDDSACLALFDRLNSDELEPGETRWALKSLLWYCGQRYSGACWHAAQAYLKGRYVPQDVSVAMQLYSQGCEQGDATCCYPLGLATLQGHNGLTRDVAAGTELINRSVSLYEQSCAKGSAYACSFLERLYSGGNPIPVNRQRVLALRKAACEAGRNDACTTGPECDWPADAGTTQMLGCSVGNVGDCWAVAYYLRTGDGMAQDFAKADEIDEWACQHGEARSCSALGDVFKGDAGLASSSQRALDLYRRACELGEKSSCFELANALEDRKDSSAEALHVRTATLYTSACEAGETDSCRTASWFHMKGKAVPQDLSRVVKLREAGCKGEDGDGCGYAGLAYRFGVHAPKDPARGISYLEASCRKETSPLSCVVVAGAYRNGESVVKNERTSNKFQAFAIRARRTLELRGCRECELRGAKKLRLDTRSSTICEDLTLDPACLARQTALDLCALFVAEEIGVCASATEPAEIRLRYEAAKPGGPRSWRQVAQTGESEKLSRCVFAALNQCPVIGMDPVEYTFELK